MFDLDKWQEIFLTIRKHKLRTVLTCFGVFWGIFMLIILLGSGAGLHRGALQNFDVARNAVFIWTRETSVAFAGFNAGRSIALSNDDMQAIRLLPEVEHLAGRLSTSSAFQNSALSIEYGRHSVSFNVMGDEDSFSKIKPYRLLQGRFLNRFDIQQQRKVTAIGTRVREALFDDGDSVIGTYIRIGGVPFQVVGVFDTHSTGNDAMRDLQTLHIPLNSAQQTFNRPNQIDWFGIIPASGFNAAQAEAAIKQLLRQRHKISASDQQALASFNVEKEYNDLQGMFKSINAFSWLVAIGTIVAGMVGVANIMLIIVKERTREIGIRKSLGAAPASIVAMVMLEAMVIAGFSGYLGLVAGVGLLEAIALIMNKFNLNSTFFAAPQIDLNVALAALAVLMISAILAGLVPGFKAARVNPVIALRDE